jgi:hypothetical protein
MVQKAEVICTATVVATQCQWKNDHRGRHIYTNVELLVGQKIKGNLPGNRVNLEVVGGMVGDITESASNSPVFVTGERTLLFLEGEPLRVAGGIMGKIPVVDDHVFWCGRKVSLEVLSTSLALGITEIPVELGEDAPSGEKYTRPTITSIVPDIGSAGTGTRVTISGTGFGESEDYGKVEFFYKAGEPRIEVSAISSWSDTQIICTVPIDIINRYAASASSGPVTITTWTGTSNGYPFRVTFGYDDQYWWGENPVASYYINENTSDCTGEGTAVQAAAETWNSTGASFRFHYAGSHTNTTAGRNGKSEIMWGTTDPRALAVTHNRWIRKLYDLNGFPVGDQIVECDMVFNDHLEFPWSTNPSPFEVDVQSIALHEFGHFLSLRDLYGDIGDSEYDLDKVMYGKGGALKRDLHRDDMSGIHWIYPPASPPAAPDSVAYPSSDDDGVYTVSWPACSTASSYQLERSTNGEDWVRVYSGPHTYFEETVDDGNYWYRVAASNVTGDSDWQTGGWSCLVQFSIWEGSGEPNDPFLISTAEQLDRIGTHSRWWSRHFKLTADIDLSGYDGQQGRPAFHIIAAEDESESWTGIFDGNDHIISNLTYISSRPGHAGLLGCMADPNAEVKHLGLVGSRVGRVEAEQNDRDRVGSLVGFLQEGTVTACSADGASIEGKIRVGGLVGENVNGKIVNCYANARVSGIDDVGGLVGYNGGLVYACSCTGTILGSGWGIGGVAGSNNEGGIVAQCYSRAAVSGIERVGGERVGGLVGDNNGGTVTQCYSTGAVGGRRGVGGALGSSSSPVTGCFWDTQTSGQATSAGGTGKTTAEMQTASTFLDAGWDFVGETADGTEDIWWILEGKDYPRLWWEAAPQ